MRFDCTETDISNYRVVSARNEALYVAMHDLEVEVGKYIESGWQVCGSVAIAEKAAIDVHTPGQSWGVAGNEWHRVYMWVLMQPMILSKEVADAKREARKAQNKAYWQRVSDNPNKAWQRRKSIWERRQAGESFEDIAEQAGIKVARAKALWRDWNRAVKLMGGE